MKPIILSHDGYLRTLLLKNQRARRNRQHPFFHVSGQMNVGVGAGPEYSVLVINGKNRDRGACAHIKPLRHSQKLESKMASGELRYGHIDRQAGIEEGPEGRRHVHKESQPIDHGHGKEVVFCIGGTEIALFAHQITDIDVPLDHHAVEGGPDIFKPNEGLNVLDLLLCCPDFRRLGLRLGELYRDGLLGERVAFSHGQVALGGQVSQLILGTFGFQIRNGLSVFGIEIRRGDFGEDIAFLHLSAVVLVPRLHVASDTRIGRCLVPPGNIAGERNGGGRRCLLGMREGHRGYGAFRGALLQGGRVDLFLAKPEHENHDSHDDD